jgi:rare lipoprotein A
MNLKKILWPCLCLVLICHLALLIGPSLLKAEEPTIKAANDVQSQIAPAEKKERGMKAVAVYYAKRYHGRKTHSGIKYDQTKMTAAHPTFRHGTRVKVVNLANHRSCVVTITDRCRKRSFNVIDLSRAAAGKLGFLGKGSAKVMLYPLKEKS